jgi:hypothetical protein
MERCHEHRTGTDKGLFPDFSWVFCVTVKVARDRTRTDIGLRTDGGISQVTHVTHLSTGSQGAVLNLAKVPYVGSFADVRSFAEMAVRSDITIGLHHSLFQDGDEHPTAMTNLGVHQ